jgi:hypothetical protein
MGAGRPEAEETGAAAMAVWSLILQLKGGHPHTVWFGDPLIGIGGIVGVVFALIVAFLTGCC